MKVEEIAQWVIDNRYPKSENNKVSDSEMYYTLIEKINQALTIPVVSVSFLYDFVNEFTDTEIPKQAIKETLDKLNER